MNHTVYRIGAVTLPKLVCDHTKLAIQQHLHKRIEIVSLHLY